MVIMDLGFRAGHLKDYFLSYIENYVHFEKKSTISHHNPTYTSHTILIKNTRLCGKYHCRIQEFLELMAETVERM